MTINKPEVVAYVDLLRGQERRYVSLRGGIDQYSLNDGDALIRLSDYEVRMAVLFNGHAVYSAMTDKAKQHTSCESVAAVLDAVVKLMREVRHDNQ